MVNYCDKCKACCIWLTIYKKEVPWLQEDKKIGTPCEKLCDIGCSIYKSRPVICKNFKCYWLQLAEQIQVVPEWRPDNLGVMVTIKKITPDESVTLILWEIEDGCLSLNHPTPSFEKFLNFIFESREVKELGAKVFMAPFGEEKLLPVKRKLVGV